MRSRSFMFVLAALVLLVTALVLSFWYTSTALDQSDSGSGSQTTTIDLGPGTLYVGPNLWGILYKEANNETVPANITAQIGVDPEVTVAKSLSDQITEAGGSHVRDDVRDDIWTIPTTAVLAVIQRPDVFYAQRHVDGPSGQVDFWPQMNDTLKLIMQSRRAGVPDDQAALRAFFAKDGKIVTGIAIPSAARREQVKTWLENENIHIPVGIDQTPTYHNLIVMLPLNQMEPLTVQYDDIRLRAETLAGYELSTDRSRWPQVARDYEDQYINLALGTTVPAIPGGGNGAAGASGQEDGPSGANGDAVR